MPIPTDQGCPICMGTGRLDVARRRLAGATEGDDDAVLARAYRGMIESEHKALGLEAELEAERARVRVLREALVAAKELAEYWINREPLYQISPENYRGWLATGHQSNSMEKIRQALATTKEQGHE